MNNFIILFLTSFLSVYIYLLIFQELSNNYKKFTIPDYFFIAISSFLIIINNLYNDLFLKGFITILIMFILFKLVFDESNTLVFYYESYIFIVTIILDYSLVIFLNLFVNNVYDLNNLSFFKIGYSLVCNYALFYIFKLKFLKKIIDDLKSKAINGNILLYLFVIIFFINILDVLYSIDYSDYKTYIIILTFLILFTIFNYLFYQNLYKNKILKVKNEYLENNIKTYEQSINDYRLLKHNLINDLLIIKCDENKDLVINETINKYNKESAWINNLSNIPSGIKGIIIIKSNYAQLQNIKIIIDNSNEFILKEKSKIYYDLCQIIEVCLDNAIEAARTSKSKIINVNLESNKIVIYNSFNNEIDLDEIGNKNYSTKINKSGLGLNYIYNLNKNIIIKNSIINDIFKSEIKIKSRL